MEENGSGAHEAGAAHVGLLTTGKGEDGKHGADSTTPPSKLSFCMSKNGGGRGRGRGENKTKLGQSEFVHGAITWGGGNPG